MDVEMVKCECCGLKEECTLDYITAVKSKFDGKWLCGLCSEAVRDEATRSSVKRNTSSSVEEAVRAHMSFCGKYKKSNPAFRVADGMRQMLRRRSVSDKALLPASAAAATGGVNGSSNSSSAVGATTGKKYYARSASASAQVGDESAALAAFY